MQEEWKEGARLFNARQYWEAHEAWEEAWKTAGGDQKKCLSALILLAAALHKRWVHGNLKNRNFDKAQRYLAQLPEVFDGIPLHALNHGVWQALSDPEATPKLPLD